MNRYSSESLGAWIQQRLRQPRAPLPRSGMSPSLAYGRHRGPCPSSARHAAVLIAIYRQHESEWTIPLTRRPETLKHHGGQVCLPGGQLERAENPAQAAYREFEEELGVRPVEIMGCGELDTQYVYNSNNRVHPVVAFIEPPATPFRPDAVEVDEVIPMKLSELLNGESRSTRKRYRSVMSRQQSVGGFKFQTPILQIGNHQVWGATAVILDQFARLLRQAAGEID